MSFLASQGLEREHLLRKPAEKFPQHQMPPFASESLDGLKFLAPPILQRGLLISRQKRSCWKIPFPRIDLESVLGKLTKVSKKRQRKGFGYPGPGAAHERKSKKIQARKK